MASDVMEVGGEAGCAQAIIRAWLGDPGRPISGSETVCRGPPIFSEGIRAIGSTMPAVARAIPDDLGKLVRHPTGIAPVFDAPRRAFRNLEPLLDPTQTVCWP